MNNVTAFLIGGVFAAIYLGCAICVVAHDRTSGGGGWITMRGMATFLITFPVSAPLEICGVHLDHRSTIDMVVAVGGSAGVVFFAIAGIASLFRSN